MMLLVLGLCSVVGFRSDMVVFLVFKKGIVIEILGLLVDWVELDIFFCKWFGV